MPRNGYHQGRVFPLTEAYEFAENCGNARVARLASLIRVRGEMTDSLNTHEAPVQTRRILMFLLFLKFGKWSEFEETCWPYDDGVFTKWDIIDELLIDYIDSEKLSQYKNELHPELQELVPWSSS